MTDAEKKEAGSTQGDVSEEIQTAEKTKPKKREEEVEEKPTRVYLFRSESCILSERSSPFLLADANVDMSRVKINPPARLKRKGLTFTFSLDRAQS